LKPAQRAGFKCPDGDSEIIVTPPEYFIDPLYMSLASEFPAPALQRITKENDLYNNKLFDIVEKERSDKEIVFTYTEKEFPNREFVVHIPSTYPHTEPGIFFNNEDIKSMRDPLLEKDPRWNGRSYSPALKVMDKIKYYTMGSFVVPFLPRFRENFMETNKYAPYTTFVKDDLMLVNMKVSDIDVEIEITLPADFPRSAPKILIKKPFPGLPLRQLAVDGKVYYVESPRKCMGEMSRKDLEMYYPELEYVSSKFVECIKARSSKFQWNGSHLGVGEALDNCVGPTIDHMKSVLEKMRPVIKRPTTDPSLLILGAHPHEAPQSYHGHTRTFYDDPNVFLLSDQPDAGDRYYRIDFLDASQMAALAFLVRNAFDEICFDHNTSYFFGGPSENLESRIQSIYNMLKPGGVFYVDAPGRTRYRGIDYKDDFLQAAREAGFELLPNDNDKFPASRYKIAVDVQIVPGGTFVKPVEKEGGRRGRSRSRRRNHTKKTKTKRSHRHSRKQ